MEWLGLFALCVALLAFWCALHLGACCDERSEAVRLNLTICGATNMASIKIGETRTAKIRPTNADQLPAPVFDIVFSEPSNLYDVVSVNGDEAVFVAVAPGTGAFVTVTAITKGGVTLVESAALPDVDAPPVDEEAVALNLTVA
jgi:hypothetical protein